MEVQILVIGMLADQLTKNIDQKIENPKQNFYCSIPIDICSSVLVLSQTTRFS